MAIDYTLIKSNTVSLFYQYGGTGEYGIITQPYIDIYGNFYLPGFLRATGSATDTTTSAASLGFCTSDDLTTTPWTDYRDSGGTTSCGQYNQTVVDMCIDSNRVKHYFVYRLTTDLTYYKYDGTTWTRVAIYTMPTNSYSFRVGMGSSNTIHLIFYNSATGVMSYYSINSSGTMSSPTSIGTYNTGGNSLSSFDMYVDEDNVIHVAVGLSNSGSSATVRYAKSSNSWSNETGIFSGVGSAGSWTVKLITDSYGYVHLAGRLFGTAGGAYSGIYYAYRDLSATWTTTTIHARDVITNVPQYAQPSITKDEDDKIYISFTISNTTITPNTYSIVYLYRDANLGSFSSETTVITRSGTSANSDILNIGFPNPNAFPTVGVQYGGPGVQRSGVIGMFFIKSSVITTGYYIWPITGVTLKSYVRGINGSGGALGTYESCGEVGQVFSSLSDLSHLEGETVSILANGIVLDQQTVSNGAITVDGNFTKIHVGLPYDSDFETLNVELPLNNGTMQGVKAKIGNVMFRLIDSKGGFIGPNEDNLYEGFTEEAFELSTGYTLASTAMFTGDIRLPLGAGYEDGGRIFYRQSDPLPITISAVVPEVSPGGPTR